MVNGSPQSPDSLCFQTISAYTSLFPFSWAMWSLGLFWPNQSLLLVPVLLVVSIGVALRECRSIETIGKFDFM